MKQKIFANLLFLLVSLSGSFNLAAMDPAAPPPVNNPGYIIGQETNVLLSQESEVEDFADSLLLSHNLVFKLNIKANNAFAISAKTSTLLADAIRKHGELKSLTIEGIKLDNSGIALLADAISTLRLNVLCLSGMAFDDAGLNSLGNLFANDTSIIVFELNDNQAISGNPGVLSFTKQFLYKNKRLRSLKILNCGQVTQGSKSTPHFYNSLMKCNPPCNLENIKLPFPLNQGIETALDSNSNRVQASIETRKGKFVVIFCASKHADFGQGKDDKLGAIEMVLPELWAYILDIFSMLDL